MAQGKKYGDDIREKALAMLAVNNNRSEVARELGVPYTTLKTWEKQALERSEALAREERAEAQGYEVTKKNDEIDLAKLRKQKKIEFINGAWECIGSAVGLLEKRIRRAVDSEATLDALLDDYESEDITEKQKAAIRSKLAALSLENIRDLAIVLGTLYDKQALANNEATQNVTVDVTKFEDL